MSFRSTPPPLAEFGDLTLQFPQPVSLDNGIPCYVVDGGDDDMNRVGIYLPAGNLMESKPSVALLTAVMLTVGNETMPADKLAEQFDYYAVRKSSYSYDYWAEVTMTSLNDNFSHTMRLLADCITRPSFPQDELDVWKRRIAGNISVLREKVRYLADARMREIYYGPDTAMGHNITSAEITDITRQDLIDFHHRNYTAAGCRVIIAGKVSQQVMNTLNETVGKWDTSLPVATTPQWVTRPLSDTLCIVDKPGAVQSAVTMRIKAVKRSHPDYLPLRVLCDALGGYFGSRLMTNIREDKGYTYGIQGALCGSADDGFIDIRCECATQHTWNVIKEIKNEMKRLREENIPVDELYMVRQDITSSLAKVHDTPYNLARYVANTMLAGIYPDDHNEHLA